MHEWVREQSKLMRQARSHTPAWVREDKKRRWTRDSHKPAWVREQARWTGADFIVAAAIVVGAIGVAVTQIRSMEPVSADPVGQVAQVTAANLTPARDSNDILDISGRALPVRTVPSLTRHAAITFTTLDRR